MATIPIKAVDIRTPNPHQTELVLCIGPDAKAVVFSMTLKQMKLVNAKLATAIYHWDQIGEKDKG